MYSETVIDAFLRFQKDTDVAKAAGISRTTVAKYRKDPELQETLRERRRELFRSAVDRMQCSLAPAAAELEKIALDPDVSPQVRINAISVLFTNARQMMEQIDLADRVAALETQKDQISALLGKYWGVR